MITRDELLDKLVNGAVWNTGVTFERTNPVPIEKYSIFESLVAAQEYAQNNPVAYPGQTLAVITEEGVVTLYIITADKSTPEKSLQEVGSKTLGDDASITLAADGTLSLYGFKDAIAGQLPQKQSDGKIKWVPISELTGATSGDGKSIVTVSDGKKGQIASIKDAAVVGNKGKILSTDGAGNVSWVDRYNDSVLTGKVAAAEGKITALEGKFTGNDANNALKLGGKDAADYVLKTDKVAESNLDTTLAKKINDKADTATVNAALEKKAVKTEVDAALKLKADKTYTDEQLALKATVAAQEATDKKAEQNKTDIATANSNIKTINDNYLKTIAFDEATSKFTFTVNEGGVATSKEVDLNLASVIKSFSYDSDTQELVLKDAEWTKEHPEGHETRVKVSALIDTYTGTDGTTVKVDVAGNAISAEVKAGTIDSTKLAEAVNTEIAKGANAQTRVAAVEGQVSALNNLGITSDKVSKWDGEVGALAQANTNKQGLADLKAVVDDGVTGLAATKKIADAAKAAADAEKGALTKATTNAADIVTLKSADTKHTQDIAANAKAIEGKENVGKAQELIDGLTGVVTGTPAADSTITALAQSNGKVTATVSKIAIAQAQVTGLPEALAEKQTAAQVNALIQAATIKQEKVEGLPAALQALQAKDAELAGKITALEKLTPAEAGAQVNKIESVKLNGVALDIAEDKSVNVELKVSGLQQDVELILDGGKAPDSSLK